MSSLIQTREPEHIKELTCGCGAKASVMWHLPLARPVEKKVKMSKTPAPLESSEPRKIQPYGWSCDAHIPPELRMP